MNSKHTFILILSLFVFMAGHTQNTEFTLHDLIPGGKTYNKYQPKTPKNLQWNGDKLLYIEGDSILSLPLQKNEKNTVIFTKQDINSLLKSLNTTELKKLDNISFPITNEPIALIKTDSSIILYNFKDKTHSQIQIPKKTQNMDFNETHNYVAYTLNNNLEIVNIHDNKIISIKSEDENIILGQAVHRNEFGINKGTFWSPKGNLLAFYRMDESMVADYPLVDISTRVATLKSTKYPMTGMKSHQVIVGILNPKTSNTIYLNTDKTNKDKYLTNIAWSPDEKYIYIAELNRKQDTLSLNRYNAETGNLDITIFDETHDKYVEPENPAIFLKNDPDKFIWLSKRNGYNHAYLYNTNGKLLEQLTSGNWDITSVCGFDNNNNIIYTSTEGSPIEQHVYCLDIKAKKRTKLSKEEGIHKAIISDSGKYICDSYTSQYNPGKIAFTTIGNNKTKVVYEAGNPYNNKKIPEITLGKIKANDGKTDLFFRLTKPVDFDSTKQYPVIIYVYGGPHSQLVTNSWMGAARGWDIYMAQKGYLIFTLDNRGTSNRGFDFENATHHKLGVIETQDQMRGLEYLSSLPYVDTNRVGVHGWSFGGFMTLNLMLRHPDIFKVGVAGGSVTDWKYYEVMYGERYMGTPKENTDGYNETSMLNKAKNLQGRLMLIHGDEDPVVVMQHSLQFLKESVKAGTHPDFFVYPGHEHNMTGSDRVHLHEHITRYFEDFLK